MVISVGRHVILKKYPNKKIEGTPLYVQQIKKDMIYLTNFGWFHISLIDVKKTKKLNKED